MKIMISPDIFRWQRYGGVSRYAIRLAEALQFEGVDCRIPAQIHINEYLAQSQFSRGLLFSHSNHAAIRKFARVVDSASLQAELAFSKYDVLHFSYYRKFPYVYTAAKRVVTVHDMISELFHSNDTSGRIETHLKKRAVSEADIILCVSENTRNNLIDIFNIPRSKTFLTHIAADLPPHPNADAVHPLNGDPYLLYVGARRGYKNFESLIRAYAESPLRHSKIKIVAFGSDPFQADELEKFKAHGLSEHSIIHMRGNDHELYNLYRNARCLVYPSLYEGFGIPPLEAMSVGCPVVCSTGGSIPEIVGDAALLFDPVDTYALASAIENMLNDTVRREELIKSGYRRFGSFSWQKCARDTLRAYKAVS